MKKILSMLLVLTSIFVLVGCGKDKKKNISEYEVKSIAELKETDVEVTFRHPFGQAITVVIEELIESFNEEYPNITIKLDPIGGYDPMKEATVYDINGGIAPTMIVGYPDHFAEYLITDSIITLDAFINAEDPEIALKDEIEDFLPGYLAENRLFDADKSFRGLPFNKSTEVMFYNSDFFKEFNLTVPKTWAEYEAVSKTILEKVATIKDGQYSWLGNIETNLDNGEFLPGMYDSTGNLFTTLIHQFDGSYTKSYFLASGATDVQSGELSFVTDAKAKEALTYMQTLANKGYINTPEVWEGQYGSGYFSNGQVLMNIGSSAGSTHYNAAKSNWEVAPIPYKDEDHKFVIQQGTNVAIFSQATDLEKLAAWMFIKHCLTPENTATFAIKTGYMPVRKSAYELEVYKNFLDPAKRTPAQIGTSKVHNAATEYTKDGWNYFVDAAWSGSSKLRKEVGTAVVEILINKVAVSKAFENAKNRYGA